MGQRWLTIFWLLTTVCSSGCFLPWNRQTQTTAPVVFEGPATREQFIEVVNANSLRVKQLQAQVKVSLQGLPSITGNLAWERPHRLRLQAELFGISGQGVDVGSNDELFWVWIKTSLPGQQSSLVYARHDRYAQSPAANKLPIEPSWIHQALGLVYIDPQGRHEGPFARADGQLELRSQVQTARGDMIKVTVIDKDYGWVTEQHMIDMTGKTIASARASKQQHYPQVGVSLPRRVDLMISPGTSEQMTLVLELGSYTINQLYADPAQLWTMPDPQGVTKIDITQPPPGMVSPAGYPSDSRYSPIPDYTGNRESFHPVYRGTIEP